MADEADGILGLIEHSWGEIHHVENQRSTVTNILIIGESALLALIVERGLSPKTIPLSAVLVLLGIFGTLITKKYYERWGYAQKRLHEFYKRLSRLLPDAEIWDCLKKADAAHDEDPRFRIGKWHLKRLALNRMWIWIHGAFILAGVLLGVLAALGVTFSWQ